MTLSIPPCHPIYDDIKERFRQLIIRIFYNIFDCSNLYHIFLVEMTIRHYFIHGRTTGIEPAHGGSTIHCLNPLGHVRLSSNLLISTK